MVASIVVLSAVVVSAVGWVLLQQTQKGLLDHRVDAVLVEVNTAVAEANRQLDGALTSSDPNEQQTELVRGPGGRLGHLGQTQGLGQGDGPLTQLVGAVPGPHLELVEPGPFEGLGRLFGERHGQQALALAEGGAVVEGDAEHAQGAS